MRNTSPHARFCHTAHEGQRLEPIQQQARTPDIAPLAYTVLDATKALRVGKTSIYELFKSGALLPVRIGGRTLIPAEQIHRLIAEAPLARPQK